MKLKLKAVAIAGAISAVAVLSFTACNATQSNENIAETATTEELNNKIEELQSQLDALTTGQLSSDAVEEEVITDNQNQARNSDENVTYIGDKEAIKIAENHAGVKSGKLVQSVIEVENGQAVYHVEFIEGNREYDYMIDASNGEIRSFDFDIEGNNPYNAQSAESALVTNEPSLVADANSITASYNDFSQEAKLTEQELKDIAFKDSGVGNAVIVKSKYEYDDGILVYEIEFYSDNTEYDYEIDANTGAILSVDKDIENFIIPNSDTSSNKADIGREKALQVALDHAQISQNNARNIQVEEDYEYNGIKIYEIEFKSGNFEFSYDIKADGTILSFERDWD